jgi:hypothetical protein
MSAPVAPELFDIVTEYAKAIEQGKIKPTPPMGSTDAALTFCQNFYLQFFQNRLNKAITTFTRAAKEDAIGILLDLKAQGAPSSVIQLITWYERLCEIYPDVLGLGYGVGTKAAFLDFHINYLPTLLERATAWARVENYPDVEQKAQGALVELRQALQSIAK